MINRLLFLCFFVVTGCAESKGKNDPIVWSCAKNECRIYAQFPSGNKIKIIDNPDEPAWKYISNDLVEVILSCGSPCSYSIFVDMKQEQVSEPFFNVVAFDTIHTRVAFGNDSLLLIRDLFEDNVCEIRKEFSPVANLSSAIEMAHFLENGALVLQYLSGPEFKTKTDTVKWCR